MWEESIRAIPKMWTQELFSWSGKYFSVPERYILPKPVQKPHPPLWVTASNPSTVETAARFGIGAAMFNFADPELLRPLVETYKTVIEKAEPVGAFVYNKIMTIAPVLCLEDGAEARDILSRNRAHVTAHFAVYFDTIPHFAERLKDVPRPIPQTKLRELIRQAAADRSLRGPFAAGSVAPEYLYQNGICVGSPDEVTRTMKRFEDIGLDQLVLVPVVGRMPHETVLESMRILGERVLPHFRK
jgi:alkanesulfonate monooxygenase SsuD/methylene tetrahydromethanopterin reductase-like flavin-dependent oxidoreductase (luciferase family)